MATTQGGESIEGRSPPSRPLTPVDWESRAMHARAERDELLVALKHEQVTFHEVARAWFGVHDTGLSPEDRESYRELFPKLLEQFTKQRHGIESDYFCEHIKVAAALTDIDRAAHTPAGVEKANGKADQSALKRWWQTRTGASASAIHLEPLLGEPEDVESRRLLSSCLDLQYRALEFLGAKHRKICMRRIFAIITALLGTLDNRASPVDGARASVALNDRETRQLNAEFEDARRYYHDHAERRVQLRYLAGMGLGVGAALALFLIAGDVRTEEPLMVSLFAGALGAVVSVMMRLTKGGLVVEREIGTPVAMLLGLVRPVIGAVFGALVYVLIEGGLLTLGVQPPRGADPLLSYAGLGFLAGFSERIAQTAVSRGAGALSNDSDDRDCKPSARPGGRAARGRA